MSYQIYNFKYNYVKVVKIPKADLKRIDFDLCQQPTETLNHYYNRQTVKPDFIMNLGFFGMSNGATCFNFMNDGKVISNNPSYRWGMGIIDEYKMLYGCIDNRSDWRDFVSGYPVLLDNCRKCSYSYANELNYKARRSVLGYDDDNIYLVAVEAPGLNFPDLQDLVLEIGMKYAINCDGGGSTKLLNPNGKSITTDATNRAVDNVVAIYLNKESNATTEQKTIYRVQTGAFRSQANAEILQSQIRALNDTIGAGYAKAYVRLVDGLYKVQVGAFSKKENAEKIKNDLASRGYNSYITTK